MTTVAEIAKVRAELESAEKAAREARIRLAVLTDDGFDMPGIRDPAAPCEAYEPGTPRGECETDGHYLCDECKERDTCDRGCGKRKSFCECKVCDKCEGIGTECSCPPEGV